MWHVMTYSHEHFLAHFSQHSFPKEMPSPSSEVGKEIYNPHLLQNTLSKHSSQDKKLKLLCRIRKATCISYDEIFFIFSINCSYLSFSFPRALFFKSYYLQLTTSTTAVKHQRSEMSHRFLTWYSLVTGPLILQQFFLIFHVLLVKTLAMLGFPIGSPLLHEAQLWCLWKLASVNNWCAETTKRCTYQRLRTSKSSLPGPSYLSFLCGSCLSGPKKPSSVWLLSPYALRGIISCFLNLLG